MIPFSGNSTNLTKLHQIFIRKFTRKKNIIFNNLPHTTIIKRALLINSMAVNSTKAFQPERKSKRYIDILDQFNDMLFWYVG